ncbi:MAG: tRNA pseudouridine(38-40) synthase TruA [Acidimicrobiia bacterium]|nr:tRNA pseudouridine(38-40) synthase TruA [Acidimicrobiia bacterium]MCY4434262.1 tRNA pseudouridine(38-40) synthase TruA [bacterium]
MRVRATVAYHGGSFHGFAINRGVRTIGGDLTEALTRYLQQPVELTCAGRTDTGVHARAQVVSFDAPDDADLLGMRTAVNRMLAPAIAIRSADAAPEGFDARFDAASRTYRYTVLNQEVPDPFLASTAWHYYRPLNVDAMNAAAAAIVGKHDFSSFCRRQHTADGNEKSRVRVVHRATWSAADEALLRFEIEASSFCHRMVRSITGALVDIGAARLPPEAMAAILAAKDRSEVPNLAPPHGLCLWSVTY